MLLELGIGMELGRFTVARTVRPYLWSRGLVGKKTPPVQKSLLDGTNPHQYPTGQEAGIL